MPDDLHGVGERQVVGVECGRGGLHQAAHGMVRQHQALDLPAFVVQGGQFVCRGPVAWSLGDTTAPHPLDRVPALFRVTVPDRQPANSTPAAEESAGGLVPCGLILYKVETWYGGTV